MSRPSKRPGQRKASAAPAVDEDAPADTTDQLLEALAVGVRGARGLRGWSLEELARRSGVSRGMLLQIEAERTNPSIATLAKISSALGVDVTELLEPPKQIGRVVSGASAVALKRGGGASQARLLVSDGRAPFVELWHFVLSPGDEIRAGAHPPGTREFLLAISGKRLVVEVGGLTLEAGAGDAIFLEADRPHTYRNAGSERVVFGLTVVYASGPTAA